MDPATRVRALFEESIALKQRTAQLLPERIAAAGERIADAQKQNPHADIFFLDQHGVSVGAPSVALAFDELYYLERACRQQAIAQASGKPLKILPDAVVRETNRQYMQQLEWSAERHFGALMRLHGL